MTKFIVCLSLAIFFFLATIACKSKSSEVGLTGDADIDRLTEAIERAPDDPELYLQRSEIYYEKEAYDQAIQDLAIVLKMDSTNLRAHHLLADVYMDDYQSALALRTLERAALLYPDSINTKLKLSEFQLILKQYDQALATLAKIMEIHPGNPEALFMLGMVYRDQGKTEQASDRQYRGPAALANRGIGESGNRVID